MLTATLCHLIVNYLKSQIKHKFINLSGKFEIV